jgi:hypothetical protein
MMRCIFKIQEKGYLVKVGFGFLISCLPGSFRKPDRDSPFAAKWQKGKEGALTWLAEITGIWPSLFDSRASLLMGKGVTIHARIGMMASD